MANSNRLDLPLLAASQAQKHVTVNETFKLLDAIIQAGVIDKDLSTPPGSPSEGDIYIVGGSATGDWAGQENDLAIYQDGAWVFVTPLDGFIAFVADENTLYVFNTSWTSLAGILGADYAPLTGASFTGDVELTQSGSPILSVKTTANSSQQASLYLQGARTGSGTPVAQYTVGNNLSGGLETIFDISSYQDYRTVYNIAFSSGEHEFQIGGSEKFNVNQYGVGINGGAADASNQLSFYGTDMLFNSGGDINMKFNKNAAGDDASVTFQQGFTTYGLMGLLANNDWTLKVGTGFHTAIVADNATGDVTFPNQTTVRSLQPFGGRWYLYTDNRWTGPLQYNNAENRNASGSTGATPTVDWDAKGDHFIKSGSVLNSLECSFNINSTEVTDVYWKLYYQYPDTWDGLSNTNGEMTRVEINGGTITPANTGYIKLDFLGGSPYTAPADGHLLLVVKPNGTLTANRYMQLTGLLDVLMDMS